MKHRSMRLPNIHMSPPRNGDSNALLRNDDDDNNNGRQQNPNGASAAGGGADSGAFGGGGEGDLELRSPGARRPCHDDADGDGDDEYSSSCDSSSRDGHRERRRSSRRRRRRCCHECVRSLLKTGSKPGSIANLCSATLGAGVLSLPFALSKTGIAPGILLLVLAASATVLSIDFVVEACDRTGLTSYEDLTVRLVGRNALILVEGCIFVFCFGCATAYIVAVGDVLQQGVIGVFDDDVLPPFVDREFCMVVFWAGIMLPLSLFERIDSLRFASLFGIGSIAFLVAACVVHSIRDLVDRGEGEEGGGDNSTNGTALWYVDELAEDENGGGGGKATNHAGEGIDWLYPESFWDVVRACPIIMFAFSCQVNVCAIYDELGVCGGGGSSGPTAAGSESVSNGSDSSTAGVSPAKSSAMKAVNRYAVFICALFYTLIGTFGYLDFSSLTQDNVLKNYCVHDTRDPMMIAAFVCITVAVVMAFPLNIFPARVTLEGVVGRLSCRIRSGRGSVVISTRAVGGTDSDEADDVADEDGTELARPLLDGGRHASDEGACPTTEEMSPTVLAPSKVRHVILTIVIAGGAVLVALIVPDISVVFGLMGGTASSVICFILPGLFVLRLESEAEADSEVEADGDRPPRPGQQRLSGALSWRKLQAWALICGGAGIGILSTAMTLYSLSSDGPLPDVCSASEDPLNGEGWIAR